MTGVPAIKQTIRRGDFGVSVDLREFFHQLGLHPVTRKWTRFWCPDHRRWQWRVLPFGMAHAPLWVTKLLAPAFKMLRMLGIRIVGYIDDILVMADTPHKAAAHLALALEILQISMNLEVKLKKCILLPARSFTALGLIWDTTAMKCSVPVKRIISMTRIATRLRNQSKTTPFLVSVRDLGRLVGSVVSARDAIDCYKRRLLHLHQELSQAIRSVGWDGNLRLSPGALSSLEWLTSKALFRHNGRNILPPVRPITITMGSDAAKLWGWGAWLRHGSLHLSTRGFFTLQERKMSINNLELLSIVYGVASLLPQVYDEAEWKKILILFANDNVSAIYYAMQAVGRSLPMSLVGAQFYDYLHHPRRNLQLVCRHIAGVLNVEADELSRRRWTHADWRLRRRGVLRHNPILRNSTECRLDGIKSQCANTSVLLVRDRTPSPRHGCFPTSLETSGPSLLLPTSDTDRSSSTEARGGASPQRSSDHPELGDTTLAPAPHVSSGRATTVSTVLTQPSVQSKWRPGVPPKVVANRLEFILHYAELAGVSKTQTRKSFLLLKQGYPQAYDTPWTEFTRWWVENPPPTGPCDLSPSSVSVPILARYLEHISDFKCHESVRRARTSISTAIANATLERTQLGSDVYIVRTMRRLKKSAGLSYKKIRMETFADIATLIGECALLGPDAALPIGLLHQKCLGLMAVDLLCRPSDLARIHRLFVADGRNAQIRFGTNTEMSPSRQYYEVRFYDSKELDVGGSRSNATNDYFSWWVRVYFATDPTTCSGRCLQHFLDRTSKAMVTSVVLPYAKITAYPLFFGPLKNNIFKVPTADYLSSLVKDFMDKTYFGFMTPCNLRGGGSSKCVQLVPSMELAVLKHCRWTTTKTFRTSYQLPVTLLTSEPVLGSSTTTVTDLLRHGIQLQAPGSLDWERFQQRPDQWVGFVIPNVGTITSFADGVYTIRDARGSTSESYHFDIMSKI